MLRHVQRAVPGSKHRQGPPRPVRAGRRLPTSRAPISLDPVLLSSGVESLSKPQTCPRPDAVGPDSAACARHEGARHAGSTDTPATPRAGHDRAALPDNPDRSSAVLSRTPGRPVPGAHSARTTTVSRSPRRPRLGRGVSFSGRPKPNRRNPTSAASQLGAIASKARGSTPGPLHFLGAPSYADPARTGNFTAYQPGEGFRASPAGFTVFTRFHVLADKWQRNPGSSCRSKAHAPSRAAHRLASSM